MAAPSLTAEGFMHWPTHDWAASLCVPLADGTWLVQAPIAGGEKPLLYLLRDAPMKDRFLFWATGLIRLRIAMRALMSSLVVIAPLIMTVGLLPDLSPPLWLWLLLVLLMLLWPIAHFVWYQQCFGWLADHAVKPPAGWKQPDTLVRSSEEWEALYLSGGLRAERTASLAGMGVMTVLILLSLSNWLTVCLGIGVLDPLFMGMSEWERASREAACGNRGLVILFNAGLLGFVVFCHLRLTRMRHAGRAVPLP